jgi:hypothetical protein
MGTAQLRLTELLSLALKKLAVDIRKAHGSRDLRVWLTQDPERLHPTLESITAKYQEKFPALRKLTFSHEGAFPYSPELTEVLATLQLTGAISRINPLFDRLSPEIYDDAEDYVGERLKADLAEDEREAFYGFVEDLKQLVVEPEPSA